MMDFAVPLVLPADHIVCVWTGTVVEASEAADALAMLSELLGLRSPAAACGCVETLPGGGGAGGRVDFVFAIAGSDAPAAAARRVRFDDIKWATDLDAALYPPPARRFLGCSL